jgi:hypothetical protein
MFSLNTGRTHETNHKNPLDEMRISWISSCVVSQKRFNVGFSVTLLDQIEIRHVLRGWFAGKSKALREDDHERCEE